MSFKMNLDIKNVILLARKEIINAKRNKWFILYAIIFAGLSLALSWLGLAGVGQYNLSGFGKTTASLINLILLIVPLMGLTLGAISIASEREKGTLLYILSQPVTHLEVLLGKFLGVGISLLAALLIGFGISGYLIAIRGGTTEIANYLSLIGFTFLLALVSLGIGMLISSTLRKTESAIGISLFLWLLLVFFGDLGVIGTSLFFKLSTSQLFTLSMLNPLQVFKIGALSAIRGNLEILGPVGLYAVRSFGGQLVYLIVGTLLGWIVILFTSTYFIFKKRGTI